MRKFASALLRLVLILVLLALGVREIFFTMQGTRLDALGSVMVNIAQATLPVFAAFIGAMAFMAWGVSYVWRGFTEK